MQIMSLALQIAENYRRLRARMTAACVRVDRAVSDVKLVAVTKYARLEWVRALLTLGVHDLGESRPQQLVERVAAIAEPVRWHMIGPLQRNKARRVLPLVTLIHSVDRLRLLKTLDGLADDLEFRPRVLLEVNIAGEASKHGFSADELLADWQTVLGCRNVQVDGLMTMAPWTDQTEAARPVFRQLRELRDRLADLSPASVTLEELSMGMSRDFEIAIEEGATFVRIGSELFGGLETG